MGDGPASQAATRGARAGGVGRDGVLPRLLVSGDHTQSLFFFKMPVGRCEPNRVDAGGVGSADVPGPGDSMRV